ncbi:MAG: hypothetical protein MJB14_13490 [Spirochaetes bacterium]|nr:hypothetical protein [Spirochaetota bacterium]
MYNSSDIITVINDIRQHYESNLNSKYVKHMMMKLNLPYNVTQDMKRLLETQIVYVDSRGAVEDIYSGIKAVGYFVKEVQATIFPNIKAFSDANISSLNQNEKILYQMAIKNYPENVMLFAEKIFHLFEMVFEFDKTKFDNNPAFKSFPGFDEISITFQELVSKK